jgi:hypothetical protein
MHCANETERYASDLLILGSQRSGSKYLKSVWAEATPDHSFHQVTLEA